MTGIDTELTLTIDDIIGFASPSTLANIIQDVRQMYEMNETNETHIALRDACELALIANVGEQVAAAMLNDDATDDACPIECPLCRKTTTLTNAPEQGWTPYYWVGREIEVDDPVCPDCAKSRLTNIDGEPCLIGTASFEPAPY